MAFGLPKLKQIEGGLQLQKDVVALQTSYDAAKVLTDIVKDEASANKYTVNELLTSLKTTVDSVVGDGDSSLKSLQDAIDLINDKKIKDIVKVSLSAVATANEVTGETDFSVVIPPDITTTVPSMEAKEYAVYEVDNTPLYDEDGNQLTFNFTTAIFSGIPSRATTTKPEGSTDYVVTYVPVTADFEFKTFPVGTFAFKDIPENAVLDNQEMQLVATDKAIDELAAKLATDKDLIQQVKELIGEKTVQDQIKAITDALATQITTLDGEVVKKTSIATAIGETPSDEKVVSEKLLSTVKTELQDYAEGISNSIYQITTTDKTKTDAELISEYLANPTGAEAGLEAPITAKVNDIAIITVNEVVESNTVVYRKCTYVHDGTSFVKQEDAGKELQDKLDLKFDKSNVVSGTADLAATADLASETKVVSEKVFVTEKVAVKTNIDDVKTNVDLIATSLTDIRKAVTKQIDIIDLTTVADDTAVAEFTLTGEPSDQIVTMVVNGLSYVEGEGAFTVDRATKKATWTATAANGGYDIDNTDKVRFEYFVGTFVDPTQNLTTVKYVSEAEVTKKINDAVGGIDLTDMATNDSVDTKISTAVGNIDLTPYATSADVDTKISSAVSSVYRYKGSVDTRAELPADAVIGDVYNVVSENGMNVAKTASGWDDLGSTVDLSAYATTASVDNKLTNYVTNTALTTSLSAYLTKTEFDAAIVIEEV